MGEGVVKRGMEGRGGRYRRTAGVESREEKETAGLPPPPPHSSPFSQSVVERNAVTVQSCVTEERLSMQETKKEEVAE